MTDLGLSTSSYDSSNGFLLDKIHWIQGHSLIALIEPEKGDFSNTSSSQTLFCFECVLDVFQDSNEIQITKCKILSRANQVLRDDPSIISHFMYVHEIFVNFMQWSIDELCYVEDAQYAENLISFVQKFSCALFKSRTLKLTIDYLASQIQSRPRQECFYLLNLLLELLKNEQSVTYEPNCSLTFVEYLYRDHWYLIQGITNNMFDICDDNIFRLIVLVLMKLYYCPEKSQLDQFYIDLSMRLIETFHSDLQEAILSYLEQLLSVVPRCLSQIVRATNAKLVAENVSSFICHKGFLILLQLAKMDPGVLVEELTIEFLLEMVLKFPQGEFANFELVPQILYYLATDKYAMEHFMPLAKEVFRSFFKFGVPSTVGFELLHYLLKTPEFVAEIPIENFATYLNSPNVVSVCENDTQCRELISAIIAGYLNGLPPMKSDVGPIVNLVHELGLLDNVSLESIESLDLILSLIPWNVEDCSIVVKHLIHFFVNRQEFLVDRPETVSRCCQIISSTFKVLFRQSILGMRLELTRKALKSNIFSTLARLESHFQSQDSAVFHIRDLIFQILVTLDSNFPMENHRNEWFLTLLAPYPEFKEYAACGIYGKNLKWKKTLKKFTFESSFNALMKASESEKSRAIRTTMIDMIYWAILFGDYGLLTVLFDNRISQVFHSVAHNMERLSLDTKSILRFSYIWAASFDTGGGDGVNLLNAKMIRVVQDLNVHVVSLMDSANNDVFLPIPLELLSWIWDHASDEYIQNDLEYFLEYLEAKDSQLAKWIPSLLKNSRAIQTLIFSISSAISVSVVRVERILSGFLLLSRLNPEEMIPLLIMYSFPLLISTKDPQNFFLHIQVVTLILLYQNRSRDSSFDEFGQYFNCLNVWIENYYFPEISGSPQASAIRLKLFNFLNLLFEFSRNRLVLNERLCNLIFEGLNSENSAENAAASLVFYYIISVNNVTISSVEQMVALIHSPNPIVSLIGVHLTEFASFQSSSKCENVNFSLICLRLLKSIAFEDAVESKIYMWKLLILCSKASTDQLSTIVKLPHHRSIIGLLLGDFLAPSQLTLAQAIYLTILMGICASLPRSDIPNEIYTALSNPKCLQKITMVLSLTEDINIFALLVVALQHAVSCGMIPRPSDSDPLVRNMIRALNKLMEGAMEGQHPAMTDCQAPPPRMPVDMNGVLIFPRLLQVPYFKIHSEKIEDRCFKLNQWLLSLLGDRKVGGSSSKRT